jgi:hypothetical protein
MNDSEKPLDPVLSRRTKGDAFRTSIPPHVVVLANGICRVLPMTNKSGKKLFYTSHPNARVHTSQSPSTMRGKSR